MSYAASQSRSLILDQLTVAKCGFLFVLAVPVAAGLGTVEGLTFGGMQYTGFLWLAMLVVGGLLIATERSLGQRDIASFPCKPWLLWAGMIWLSLVWCDGVGTGNVQAALQITMPVLVGFAAFVFVRSERQLASLVRGFRATLLVLALAVAAGYAGLLSMDPEATGLGLAARTLALTAALIGCVFLAGTSSNRWISFVGWLACVGLTVATSSRMATAALLLVPIFHPSLRNPILRIAALVFVAAAGLWLFYTPAFQERFFVEGSGTVTDVYEGNFLTSGRMEVWPSILEQAHRRPVLGHGAGSINQFVPTVWHRMEHAHNDYLRIGFELGLVGLTIFAAVVVWQIMNLRRRIRTSNGLVRRVFVASLLGWCLFLIVALTDNPLAYNLWFMNPLFALMGAAYGVAARQDQVPPPGVDPPLHMEAK